MNQIVKILIAVISACFAIVLVYFLISKVNNFEHEHPKDIALKVNESHVQNEALKSKFINNFNENSQGVMETTKRPADSPESLKMHKNFKLFNNERCGVHTGVHKIHNGKETELKANPWMVAIVYFNEKTNTTSVDCAGTLISENLVLTAAHCLQSKTPIAVRLGDYNLASDPDCVTNNDNKIECAEKVQEITNFTLKRHEHHWRQVFEDIALIKLNEPAKLHQENINTICLPFAQDNVSVDDVFYITGWGRIDNNNTFSNVLLGTYVDYVTHEDCRKSISSTLTKGHICAGSEDGSDSCRGDSGGPLTQLRYLDEKIRAVQYGIVSYGPKGDCGKGPGVYTNVHRYLQWILNNADL
ncbi:venom protease-like [Chironomus tepperi]|uniref:venom protease-like n=1 Tax=Chironomus tepperi TaxID=113505 RepID=UPI00391F3277